MIKANQAKFTVSTMCQHLQVSRSGYYDWSRRKPTARQIANSELLARIKEIYKQSDSTYGMPRIHAVLKSMGECINKKRVARLMRLAGIQGVSRRRNFIVTTRKGRSKRVIPDLVERQFVASALNELWVADMTYLPTWQGFIYLAVVIDVYSRKVVGWAFSSGMTTQVVINALNMALSMRKPRAVIHHSDQGAQYTSIAFGKRCKQMGVKPSMGSKGDAYDNAMAESFFASLECELINRKTWKTKTQARMEVFSWIEAWYNPHRLHSGISYLSPVNFERSLLIHNTNHHQHVASSVIS